MNNATTAAECQPCARCGAPILPGARMQRGCHWRCYMACYRAGTAGALPLAKQGRPISPHSRRGMARALVEAMHGR